MTPRSILCPVDFSAHSRRALECAVGLASLHDARLIVHTTIDPLLAQAAAITTGSDYLRDTRADLRAFVAVAPHGVSWAPHPRLIVTIGDAADQILDVAAFHAVDLIVMGTQGLGGVRRMVFGSTTEGVLRRSTVPVLAVPLEGEPLVTLDPKGPRMQQRPVLAAVDLRAGARVLAHAAADAAAAAGAPLLLVHVVHPLETTERWRRCRDSATHLHVATAQAAVEGLAAEFPLTVEPLVVTGHVADALVQTAESRNAGLIVLGIGSGEDGARRPGSTAYRMLCLATVPILALPPPAAFETEQTSVLRFKEVVA